MHSGSRTRSLHGGPVGLEAGRGPRLLAAWRRIGTVAVLLLLSTVTPRAGGSVRAGDAFIDEGDGGRRWLIGNSALTYSLGISNGNFVVEALSRTGGARAVEIEGPDTQLTLDGEDRPFGQLRSGFAFAYAETAVEGDAVELIVAMRLEARRLTVERHYRVYSGVPVLEMWSRATTDGEPVALNDLNAFTLPLPARDLSWLTGLAVSEDEGGPFAVREQQVSAGDSLTIGSPTLSSERAMPWMALTGEAFHAFAGLAWSGGWAATVEGTARGVTVSMGLPRMSARVTAEEPVEGPHAYLGVVDGQPGADAEAFGQWIVARRGGRGFPAFSTFNTWFTHGIRISDHEARSDMADFAALGGELFQLDAGWYPGAGARDLWDFTTGLGSWEVDAGRFPDGLGAVADRAHDLGLRFGVWVEPERVALTTVDRPGLAQERFLATVDGAYEPGVANDEAPAAQICLGDRAARAWVLERLSRFLDEAHPDYLKWDVNYWVHCNRPDHGHPADGGNFAHVRGLYALLDEVRRRYPGLLIENCSEGGHRLDAELLTRTDAAWVDDRSSPSARVRSHIEGLTRMLPASTLLAYVMSGGGEEVSLNGDLRLLTRSRMPGVFGLTAPLGSLGEGEREELSREIALYHALRATRGQAVTLVLTPPVRTDGTGPEWDVIEQWNPASGDAVVFAYRNDGGADRVRVRLERLDPGSTYAVRSPDDDWAGLASGSRLMTDGLEIASRPESASRVFIITRQ